MKKSSFILGISSLLLMSCETLQPLVGELSRAVLEEPASVIPTELEMGNGLKEALN